MMKFFILLLFILGVQAQANEEFSVKNYNSETAKSIATMDTEVSTKNSINEVKIINNSNLVANPIFPISVQFLGRNDLKIIKDRCSYQVLKPKESCVFSFLNKDNFVFNLDLFFYGKEENKKTLKFGNKPLEIQTLQLPANEIKIKSFPLVEKIGVENYHQWPIEVSEEIKNLSVVNELDKVYLEVEKTDKGFYLKAYPKKEDLFDFTAKVVVNDSLYLIPLKFTSMVRKPFKISIIPNIETLPVSKKPQKIQVAAEYVTGEPKKAVLSNFLVDWNSEFINEEGEFIPSTPGDYKIKVKVLGVIAEEMTFKVQEYWPYGKDKSLTVKSGEVKELSSMVTDFETLEIKPQGTLIIKVDNPWAFIGVKNKFTNNGVIEFLQPYSGDISSNLPNFDGSLSGKRINIQTPNNNLMNGGFLYIKAKDISGVGSFKLGDKKVNQGQLYLEYEENNDSKFKLSSEQIIQSTYSNPVILKPELKFNELDVDKKVYRPIPIKGADSSQWSVDISLFSLIRYLIGAVLMFVVLYFVVYNKIKQYKIQPERPKWSQIKRELIFSFIGTFIVSFGISIATLEILRYFGLFKFYIDIEEHGIWYLILSYP